MNVLIRIIAAVLLVFTASVIAGESDHHTPYTGSAEFERLKGLAGSWQEWVMYQDGKPVGSTTFRLQRVAQS